MQMALLRIEKSNHLSFLDIHQNYFCAGCNTITGWGYGRFSLINLVLGDLVCSTNFVEKRRRFTLAVFGFLLCCAQCCFHISSGKTNSNKSSAKWRASSTKRVKRRQYGQVRGATTAYGHFDPRTELFHSFVEEKNEPIKQISGSERNNFLYSGRNDHGTKRPDTATAGLTLISETNFFYSESSLVTSIDLQCGRFQSVSQNSRFL